ncbi:MAG: cyclic nucleotide-binding domain-containing protein [Acidobacteria bacterium]|nr:cyclic nucleotide-binding domain-containing protein [Acidobacteriota bacterium]
MPSSSTEIYPFIRCRPAVDPSFKVFLETAPELQSLKHRLVIPRGAALFAEGDRPTGIYILISGRMELITCVSTTTRILVPAVEGGQVLGLSAAILATPNEYTAEASERCQVEFIRRDDVLRLMREHREIGLQFARLVSEDCRRIVELRRLLMLHQVETVYASGSRLHRPLTGV